MTLSSSRLRLESKIFTFVRQESTTKATPSIVIEVSAIFVATMTFRELKGADSKILTYSARGKPP